MSLGIQPPPYFLSMKYYYLILSQGGNFPAPPTIRVKADYCLNRQVIKLRRLLEMISNDVPRTVLAPLSALEGGYMDFLRAGPPKWPISHLNAAVNNSAAPV